MLSNAKDWMSAHEINDNMGIDRKALTGVMGALGNRTKRIKGWPRRDAGVKPTTPLWDHERRVEDGRHVDYYRITQLLRQVIKSLAIINGGGR